MEVPVDFVKNDDESQPRFIEADHVRKLAVDFSVHPVHEPSNCRVVLDGPDVADLLQFDGQHKTTAQIILGRKFVPMKLYYEPSEPMIQELVVQIQQGIKKRPLSTTDTLRKLDDVVKDRVQAFVKANDGRTPTEIELVKAQPLSEQRAFKSRLLENYEFAIMSDDDLTIGDLVSTKPDRAKVVTDKVLIRRLIRPLVSQELIDEPLDNALQREAERKTVVALLNIIYDEMLDGKWHPLDRAENESVTTQRARTFFMQGGLAWAIEIFLLGVRATLPLSRSKRLFVEPLTDDEMARFGGYLRAICAWDVWSTQDSEKLAAFRSNTMVNVQRAFPSYDHIKMQKDAEAAAT